MVSVPPPSFAGETRRAASARCNPSMNAWRSATSRSLSPRVSGFRPQAHLPAIACRPAAHQILRLTDTQPLLQHPLQSATCSGAVGSPRRARACPSLISPAPSARCTRSGRASRRRVLVTLARERPTRSATAAWVSPKSSISCR